MAWYFILVLFFCYIIGEYIIGFFFNYKLIMISVGNFNIAALMGAISTILFSILVAAAGYVATDTSQWWLILVAAAGFGIGNFFASITVPIISRHLGHLAKKDNKCPPILDEEINQLELLEQAKEKLEKEQH